MKIHQMPIGTRFLYEGEEYTKTGPMVAAGKSGQRLVPKHAVLTPMGDATTASNIPVTDSIARSIVIDAFDSFYARCERIVPEQRLGDLRAARIDFLKRI